MGSQSKGSIGFAAEYQQQPAPLDSRQLLVRAVYGAEPTRGCLRSCLYRDAAATITQLRQDLAKAQAG